jgi:acyl carrier protein
VGDVRELGSLEAFHGSVVPHKYPDECDPHKLSDAVRQRVERENELVFDPCWFEQFSATRPSITSVDTTYKEGRLRSEVVDYRYDVVLRKGGATQRQMPELVHDCDANDTDLNGLWHRLTFEQPQSVLVSNLLNSRHHDAFAFLHSLGMKSPRDVDLSRGLTSDPDAAVSRSGALGYRASLLLDPCGSPAHFAALLVPDGPDVSVWSHRPVLDTARETPTVLSNEAQQSLAMPNHDHGELIAELRRTATAHLPSAMCPTHYVVIRQLPRTPASKIDRGALPSPSRARPAVSQSFVRPCDSLERQLINLISTTLGLSTVGASDNFFELGADSMATVELLLAIEEALQFSIALNDFLS